MWLPFVSWSEKRIERSKSWGRFRAQQRCDGYMYIIDSRRVWFRTFEYAYFSFGLLLFQYEKNSYTHFAIYYLANELLLLNYSKSTNKNYWFVTKNIFHVKVNHQLFTNLRSFLIKRIAYECITYKKTKKRYEHFCNKDILSRGGIRTTSNKQHQRRL